MTRLLSRHHPAANPSPPFPLCSAAGQRGRGGEGLAEAQLPHIFQDGVSPFAPGEATDRPQVAALRGRSYAQGGAQLPADSWYCADVMLASITSLSFQAET